MSYLSSNIANYAHLQNLRNYCLQKFSGSKIPQSGIAEIVYFLIFFFSKLLHSAEDIMRAAAECESLQQLRLQVGDLLSFQRAASHKNPLSLSLPLA
jgi:hypothetical protein